MSSGDIVMGVVLVALILMSAYFSATETAFSSLNRIRLKHLANSGSKRAAFTLRISENYDKLLSTILIGNNIVNIASASLATVLFTKHFGDAGVTISTVVVTVAVLIFGEISPKSIAKDAPESFAMVSAPAINFLMVLLTPLNFLFSQWKKMISRLFQVKSKEGITEEEFLTIVEEAENQGGINEREGALIRNAIEFDDLDVADIVTPRVDIVAVKETDGKEQIEKVFVESGHTRLPVYRDTIDNIIGIINQKDFHNQVQCGTQPISAVIKPTEFVAPGMKISKLLKLLQKNKIHVAVVVDEYGGVVGLVTLEDIIEELVGEIWDENDKVVQEFKKISETEYQISGSASLMKMSRLFHIDVEEDIDVTTVSGWVSKILDRVPQQGDSFTYQNLEVRVTKTDRQRVVEIDVTIAGQKIKPLEK